jgi:methionyl-tRNA synthetase
MSSFIFKRLQDHGHLTKMASAQFFDTSIQKFLNGRQVTGQCPINGCQSERGYADECSLGHQYLPQELINPISTISGTTPELKDIENWYIEVNSVKPALDAWLQQCKDKRSIRKFALSDIEEFFAAPIVHVHKKHEETLNSIIDRLPQHTRNEGKGKSFQIEFLSLSDREAACELLSAAGIQFRNGKTLVPFRLTGNIQWGIPVPDEADLTFWVWPESLWAPISFTSTYLESIGEDKDSWTDWWCSTESQVYQFIGEDNVYFYGPAQTALFAGVNSSQSDGITTDGHLQHTNLIVNKHLLFLNNKASSSGKIKPPMAKELLSEYSAEQLRAHFISLGLGMKNISFAPKSYDPNKGEKDSDPVMKEAQLLSNILNRIVRNAFYTAQKCSSGKIPVGSVSQEVLKDCQMTILNYERSMASQNLHQTFGNAEKMIRRANKWWSKISRSIDWDNPGDEVNQPLIDLFHYVRVATVLMHPIAPTGAERVLSHLNMDERFWSWEHIFESNHFFVNDPYEHQLVEVPPRTDFF